MFGEANMLEISPDMMKVRIKTSVFIELFTLHGRHTDEMQITDKLALCNIITSLDTWKFFVLYNYNMLTNVVILLFLDGSCCSRELSTNSEYTYAITLQVKAN